MISGINVPWATTELTQFIELTRLVQPPPRPDIVVLGDSRRPAGNRDEIIASAQVVEQILDRLLPRWRAEVPEDPGKRWQQHREAALRALEHLKRQEEVAANLGDDAPRLSASIMHPWIWDAARSLWQSGHYAEAVGAAARKVNAELQNRLDRPDVSEAALFFEAFSDDEPKPGRPRLRLPADDDSKTAKSMRRGIRALAEGAYAALRNPLSHDVTELREEAALEQLAVFSILARWVDDAHGLWEQ